MADTANVPRIKPHALRHYRLTKLSKEGRNEIELRKFAGWTPSSCMSSIYCHIDQNHVHNKLKMRNNIPVDVDETKADKSFNPVSCSACGKQNLSTTVYCDCGQLLKQEVPTTFSINSEQQKSNHFPL